MCELFKNSHIAGCTSAGEIYEDELDEESVVVAVMHLEKSRLESVKVTIESAEESRSAGRHIAKALKGEDLKAVFILSEGLLINGSELTKGINEILDEKSVVVTGGLAGDDGRFEKTSILHGCTLSSGAIAAIGFYGECFHAASAFRGGWDRFGIERKITSSENNILYALNDEPALKVYERYLGKKAEELPFSGLFFPLALRESDGKEVKVRTILGIDRKRQSITFAGDMPEGEYATLMKGNTERLIDAAAQAAETVLSGAGGLDGHTALCIAVSCVGRKLFLGQRSEEELEAVRETLPSSKSIVGFYSYGEISPMKSGECDLHNQTMTLSLWWEECDA